MLKDEEFKDRDVRAVDGNMLRTEEMYRVIRTQQLLEACVGIYAGETKLKYDSFGDPGGGHFVISLGDTVIEHHNISVSEMLVCDEGGAIETGDFLTTSSTPGYLMKQSDDIFRSYTVAQAQEDAVFVDGKDGIYGYLKK